MQDSVISLQVFIFQISCSQVENSKKKFQEASSGCGEKNPSLNAIGKKRKPNNRKKKPSIKLPPTKSASEIFQELENLPNLTEFDKNNLGNINN